tara:strand:- start:686 stop:898 length:213 start_codon:yes stop_codon:yes gene_type:complete
MAKKDKVCYFCGYKAKSLKTYDKVKDLSFSCCDLCYDAPRRFHTQAHMQIIFYVGNKIIEKLGENKSCNL